MGNSDSKVAFSTGFSKLASEEKIDAEDPIWESLLGVDCDISPDLIFESISPTLIRQLKTEKPATLQILLWKIVDKMRAVNNLPHWEVAKSSNQSLLCVRLLTRLIPILIEDAGDLKTEKLFWAPGGIQAADDWQTATVASSKLPAASTSDEKTADDSEKEKGQPAHTISEDDIFSQKIIGKAILHSLMRLMFLHDFSTNVHDFSTNNGKVDASALPTTKVEPNCLWLGGVGVSKDLPIQSTHSHFSPRVECLRCLLCCLSGTLFQNLNEYKAAPSRWILHFTGGEVCYSANLFCSMMSFVFQYDSVGWRKN